MQRVRILDTYPLGLEATDIEKSIHGLIGRVDVEISYSQMIVVTVDDVPGLDSGVVTVLYPGEWEPAE